MTDDDAIRIAIGELADATGLSAHTLRYYEDAGLIPKVERNEAGHRRYRPEHERWIGLLDRLKTSGMSIARMRKYVELAQRGDATREERGRLLRRHQADIEARIDELRQCLEIVRAKIALYEGRITDPEIVWDLVDKARRPHSRATNGLRSHS
jgi:DNA-binding transcriptional MerR regulator